MPRVNIKGVGMVDMPDGMSRDEMLNILRGKYSPQVGSLRADPVVGSFANADLTPQAMPVEQTFAQMIGEGVESGLSGLGFSDTTARKMGGLSSTASEFLPPVASAQAGSDAVNSAMQGDYLGALGNTALGALEVNPVGDAIGAGVGALASVVPVVAKKSKGLFDEIGQNFVDRMGLPETNQDLSTMAGSTATIKDMVKNPKYFESEKDKAFDIVSMSPDEYLDKSAGILGISKDELEARMLKGDRLESMMDLATKQDDKIQMPYLDYTTGGQEGNHRAMVAKQLGVEQMPTMVIDKPKSLIDSIGETQLDLNKVDFGEVNGQFTTKATEGAVQDSGGLRGSAGILEQSVWQSPSYAPAVQREQGQKLVGLPDVEGFEVRNDPVISSIAQDYMSSLGEPYAPQSLYKPANPARGKEIARMFDEMPHNPSDPEVQKAYNALANETLEQYKYLIDNGYTFDFIDFNKMDDPYPNPRMAIEDIRNNKHMWIFPTDDGFGSGDFDPADNPLLAVTDFEISGKPAMVNDIFRAVHDVFGHAKESAGFRAGGEETAWRMHSGMYSPLARRALTTETRGQNSWVNFGKFGEQNRTASPADTTYADQKIGLLPEWVSESYADNYTDKFDEILDKGLLDRL